MEDGRIGEHTSLTGDLEHLLSVYYVVYQRGCR